MYSGLIIFQEHYSIGWGLMALWNYFYRLEIQRYLVVDAPQCGVRNASPTPRNWPMYMTEKYMAYIAVDRYCLSYFITVRSKTESVEAGNTDMERRMMHEKIDWYIN